MTISQAPILGQVREIDVSKKSRLVGESGQFKRYNVKTTKFKQVIMQKKKFMKDIRPKFINVSFEKKASLRLINKYQYRRDRNDQCDISLQRLEGIAVNYEDNK